MYVLQIMIIFQHVRVFIGFIKGVRQDEPSWSVYQVDGTPPTE